MCQGAEIMSPMKKRQRQIDKETETEREIEKII